VASEKLLNAARDGKLEQVKKYLAIGGEPDGKVDSVSRVDYGYSIA
jgi:hypothetical protein